MKTTLKGVNLTLTPSLHRYVEEKLVDSIKRLLSGHVADEASVLDIELIHSTKHHKKGNVWGAAANLRLPQENFWKKVSAEEIHTAVDGLEDVLKREIKKYKERSRSRLLRGARQAKTLLHLDRSARPTRKGRLRREGL